jgi:tetraacyldisaccharide 4'-kinase
VYRLRRAAYRWGLRRATRLDVAVVVVGNITVGGTGKTPLVAWLAGALTRAGRKPAILCRSYRARATTPARVQPSSDPRVHGDEAVLLARLQSGPVWSGPNRVATAVALRRAHPEVDVVICDDGLQHYALARDCEIAVIDAMRGLGNGLLLPAGPLREPASRLETVDAVIMHGGTGASKDTTVPRFSMRLEGKRFYSLVERDIEVDADWFAGRRVAAIAGIGNPERFFAHLRSLGVRFSAYGFPDHHPFRPGDLSALDAEAVLMTEKDAIKCAAFADRRVWVLPVVADVSDPLVPLVIARISSGGDRGADRRTISRVK